MAVKEKLLNGLLVKEVKQVLLDLLMGSLSKLEPPLFFRKLLVLEMRPSPGWGRKEEADGERSPRGVLRVHNTAVEEVGWL